jgi:hypothetical protein
MEKSGIGEQPVYLSVGDSEYWLEMARIDWDDPSPARKAAKLAAYEQNPDACRSAFKEVVAHERLQAGLAELRQRQAAETAAKPRRAGVASWLVSQLSPKYN